MTIRIDLTYCKGCGICIWACRHKALGFGQTRVASGQRAPKLLDPERCTGCRNCEMACPDLAIWVEQ